MYTPGPYTSVPHTSGLLPHTLSSLSSTIYPGDMTTSLSNGPLRINSITSATKVSGKTQALLWSCVTASVS